MQKKCTIYKKYAKNMLESDSNKYAKNMPNMQKICPICKKYAKNGQRAKPISFTFNMQIYNISKKKNKRAKNIQKKNKRAKNM